MRLKFPLCNTYIDIVVEDSSRRSKRQKSKLRTALPNVTESVPETVTEELPEAVGDPEPPAQVEQPQDVKQPILMVETENIQHDKFRKTEEVKVRNEIFSMLIRQDSAFYCYISS